MLCSIGKHIEEERPQIHNIYKAMTRQTRQTALVQNKADDLVQHTKSNKESNKQAT